MRASVNQLVNKLGSEQVQARLARTLSQFTPEEMQAVCVAMQANPVCAAQLVNVTNRIMADASHDLQTATARLVQHVGTTLQVGIMVGFLLSTELGLIEVPGGAS